jgi:hypothetical protein
VKKLSTPVKKRAQAVVIPLLLLSALGFSGLSSPVLALDDISDCTYDFFTGHCTYGGPYDEPPHPEPEVLEPYEDTPYTPGQNQGYNNPPPPPPQSTDTPPDELAPVCYRKPYLPQCGE